MAQSQSTKPPIFDVIDIEREIEELKETAARYREEAKRVFLHIENCSLVTAQVRRTCAEMKEKIAVSTRIETKAKEK